MALEYTDQLHFQYSFLPGKGMCRLWQLQAQRASSATPKGKQCKLKGQAVQAPKASNAMQAQKASNASPKGRLCKPERQAMQAKPYLRFVLEVERLLLFSSLRCCAGGCPLTLLIRSILAACTTCISQEADINSMHASALTQKLTACLWPILTTGWLCDGVCCAEESLFCSGS